MDKQTVRDVIGEPESWPNQMTGEYNGIPNIRGAKITQVIASGDQIAVQTEGAAGGETFSVFVIEDAALRERTARALRVGALVHEAVASEI